REGSSAGGSRTDGDGWPRGARAAPAEVPRPPAAAARLSLHGVFRTPPAEDIHGRTDFFGTHAGDSIDLVAPARHLVHPVGLAVDEEVPQRLHERDALAIAVRDLAGQVHVGLLAFPLDDPAAHPGDEPAVVVERACRKTPDRFDVGDDPFAIGRRLLVAAVERF